MRLRRRHVANTLAIAAVTLIVLKLASVIELSWAWVLAPIWMPMAVCFGILVAVFVGALWEKRG